MPLPFAINGLGRIGRALLRIARERSELELVAVNDLVDPEVLARLVARDSVHGPYPGRVEAEEGALLLDGRRVPVFSAPEPAAIPWEETGARAVVEATGHFLAREKAAGHLRGSVRQVILSANGEDADLTVCLGVNHQQLDARRHRVVSNASCTTNAAALITKVLDDAFGVRHALTHSVHSYMVDQRLQESAHRDPRLGRAAGINIIPTSTTAAAGVGRLLPHLAGQLQGMGSRVPVAGGAMLDLVAELAAPAREEEIRGAFRDAARGALAGLLEVSEEPLVSSDFLGHPASAVVDLPLIQLAGDRLCRVVAWYDNEWGYAQRLGDLLTLLLDP